MARLIQSVSIWKEVVLKNPQLEWDKTKREKPAWIKFKKPVKSKFLTINFGYGNKAYIEFLHSGYYLPVNRAKEDIMQLYDRFAKNYEDIITVFGDETGAIECAVDKFCTLKMFKSAKVLDVGAGTGRGAEVLIDRGYGNVTLLDASGKMLEQAKRKPILKHCKFIKSEFTKFNSRVKYDVVASFFAFGLSSYFSEEEVLDNCAKISKMLKPRGVVVFVGVADTSIFAKHFRRIYAGSYVLKPGLKAAYFIGGKK